jgi:hypothetical protein
MGTREISCSIASGSTCQGVNSKQIWRSEEQSSSISHQIITNENICIYQNHYYELKKKFYLSVDKCPYMYIFYQKNPVL